MADKEITEYDDLLNLSDDVEMYLDRNGVLFKTSVSAIKELFYDSLFQDETSAPIISSISIYPKLEDIKYGSYVSLNAEVSGFPELYYEWYKDYQLVSTDVEYHIPKFNVDNEGSYYLTVYNSFGEIRSDEFILSAVKAPEIQIEQVLDEEGNVISEGAIPSETVEEMVLYSPDILSFFVYPMDKGIFNVGDSIKLSVAVVNMDENSYYEWYRDDVLLFTTKDPEYYIEYIEDEDIASYFVRCYNSSGYTDTPAISLFGNVDEQKYYSRCKGFPVKNFIDNSVGWNLTEPVTAYYSGSIGFDCCDLSNSRYKEFYIDDLTQEELTYLSNFVAFNVFEYSSTYSNYGVRNQFFNSPFKKIVINSTNYDMIVDRYTGNGVDLNDIIVYSVNLI